MCISDASRMRSRRVPVWQKRGMALMYVLLQLYCEVLRLHGRVSCAFRTHLICVSDMFKRYLRAELYRNGKAVQTVKQFLKRCADPHKALMVYHSIPLHNGYLPSELLMNLLICTPLPIIESQLVPSVPDYNIIDNKETQYKNDNKRNFDSHHRVIPLDPLDSGQSLWITGRRNSGVVIQPAATPRLYVVSTPTGSVRRNCQHLTVVPESHRDPDVPEHANAPEHNMVVEPSSTEMQITRSGRLMATIIRFSVIGPPC